MEIKVRNYFVSDPGTVLIFQDGRAEEYAILGHYGRDEKYIQFMRDGMDIHKATYSQCYGVPYEEVTEEQRGLGKTLGFGLVYSLGNPAFAKAIGYKIDEDLLKQGTRYLYQNFKPWKIPPYCMDLGLETLLHGVDDEKIIEGIKYFMSDYVQEALKAAIALKKKYFGQFPGIQQFLKDAAKAGSDRGYVKTWSGRRRHFKKPKEEGYKAPNAIIQGTCGDIMKKKLHEVTQFLLPYQTRIINSVHDEICTRHPITREEILLIPKINEILCDLPFRVPISWGIDWGYKWGEKRKFTTIEELMEELHV